MAKTVKNEVVDYSKPLKNTRHERFSQEYHKSLNAAISYGIAYPKASKATAETNGPALLRNTQVKDRVDYLQSQLSAMCGVDAERLMEEWKKLGFANIQDVTGPDNRIKDISKLSRDIAASISSISTTTKKGGDKTVKITSCSKETALENMGKMIGAYSKDNEQRGVVLYNPELK